MKHLNCCFSSNWDHNKAWDLGRVGDFEFVLGRCSNCGEYWMSAYCVAVSTGEYARVSGEDAQKMLSLPPGPELKAFLKEWERKYI
jgi:hypothetical protein